MNKRAILYAALAAALMLTACGRAGAPLSPYEADVKRAKADKTPRPEKPVTDRPFVLDSLLD